MSEEFYPGPGLNLTTGWLNSAGMYGFAPPAHSPVLDGAGAFVTAPISEHARTPAGRRICLSFPGGVLLHSGFPNPGFNSVVRNYAVRWQNSPLPVWVHLLADSPSGLERMVRRLEEMEGVQTLELNMEPGQLDEELDEWINAASGELPLVVCVPPDRLDHQLVERLARLGVSAVSFAPRRGALPYPGGGMVEGRLFGPALYPQTLALVRRAKDWGLPLIASGGVYSRSQVEQLTTAGALAVQVDTALWRGW